MYLFTGGIENVDSVRRYARKPSLARASSGDGSHTIPSWSPQYRKKGRKEVGWGKPRCIGCKSLFRQRCRRDDPGLTATALQHAMLIGCWANSCSTRLRRISITWVDDGALATTEGSILFFRM